MNEIVKTPNPILRKKTEDVKRVDARLLKLIDQMWKTLEGKGVGLAAPQVGKSINLAIIGFTPTEEQLKKDPDIAAVPNMVIINPKIVWKSKDMKVEKEGCLSIEKIEVDVERYKKIHLQYKDKNMQKKTLKAKGYIARILQHEIDHLNGRLITDYE